MLASKSELFAVLRQYNPWWDGKRIPDLPNWRRAAFREVSLWLNEPPTHRAVLLSGARQIGKTTLLLQAIESMIATGIKPSRILYATLDHPLLKLTGAEKLLELTLVRHGSLSFYADPKLGGRQPRVGVRRPPA